MILVLIMVITWTYLTYGQNIFHTYFLITPEDNRNYLIGITISVLLLFLLMLLCMNGLTDVAWLFFILPYAVSGIIMLAKTINTPNNNNQAQPQQVQLHMGPLGAPEV